MLKAHFSNLVKYGRYLFQTYIWRENYFNYEAVMKQKKVTHADLGQIFMVMIKYFAIEAKGICRVKQVEKAIISARLIQVRCIKIIQ